MRTTGTEKCSLGAYFLGRNMWRIRILRARVYTRTVHYAYATVTLERCSAPGKKNARKQKTTLSTMSDSAAAVADLAFAASPTH
jgi:hypothetical protein